MVTHDNTEQCHQERCKSILGSLRLIRTDVIFLFLTRYGDEWHQSFGQIQQVIRLKVEEISMKIYVGYVESIFFRRPLLDYEYLLLTFLGSSQTFSNFISLRSQIDRVIMIRLLSGALLTISNRQLIAQRAFGAGGTSATAGVLADSAVGPVSRLSYFLSNRRARAGKMFIWRIRWSAPSWGNTRLGLSLRSLIARKCRSWKVLIPLHHGRFKPHQRFKYILKVSLRDLVLVTWSCNS